MASTVPIILAALVLNIIGNLAGMKGWPSSGLQQKMWIIPGRRLVSGNLFTSELPVREFRT